MGFENLLLGFHVAITPFNLFVAVVGITLGTVIGVLPATRNKGTLHDAALMTPPSALAVPGKVCTNTICGFCVTL